jgi:glycosyltransferase involved in cell wall biosynthesis
VKIHVLTAELLDAGGGVATYYRHLLPALAAQGCEVQVTEGGATRAVAGGAEGQIAGVPVRVLELERLNRWRGRFPALAAAPHLQREIAAAWAIWELAAEAQTADVVETCDFGLSFLPPLLAAGPPTVAQMHGSGGQLAGHDPIAGRELDGGLRLALETGALPSAASVQTSSSRNAAYWSAQCGRAVDVLRPAWRPEHPFAPSAGDRLVVVGRLQRWKGPEALCEALRRLGPRAPGVDWYGRDTAFERAGQPMSARLAERYPDIWGQAFQHRGPATSQVIAERQASALLNVAPSTWDVFNLAAVEAMASGRPLVISAQAGASELVRDGETGFVYDADDVDALARTLDRALALPAERLAAIGAAAREAVVEALDPARIAAERIAAYELAARAGPRAAVPDFVRRLGSPGAEADGLEFLDNLPLSALAANLARRGLGKVLKR